MKKKVVLVIVDGLGYTKKKKYNAFLNAKTPVYDDLFKKYPNSLLKTSGKSAGLPDGQMGNSEVGHQTIGSGRVLYQDIIKINNAIAQNTLKNNQNLNKFIENSDAIHLIGLLSDGGVHSHIDHFLYLIKICAQKKKVYLHIFSDGRDVSPKSIKKYLNILKKELKSYKNVEIATLSGRYWAMDRDKNWNRTQKTYSAITEAKPKTTTDIQKYINDSYEQDIFDEFIEPMSFGNYEGIKEDDGIIFINFRNDRMRAITKALTQQNFKEFKRKLIIKHTLTMTQYDEKFKCSIIFPKETPQNTLGEIVAKNKLTQARVAETEKYAHVTFFFNGGIETPFVGESRCLIKSPDVKSYDQKPQMSAQKVCEETQNFMEKEIDFIVVNFANCDMVGHTANYEATIKAVECIDSQIGKLLKKAKEKNYSIILSSDHGNCEEVLDASGNPITKHTTNDVYCFLIDDTVNKISNGGLDNIAPTILKLLNLDIPQEMSKPLF